MNITKLGHLKKLSFHIDKIRLKVQHKVSKKKTPPPPPLRQNKPQLSPPSNYPKVALRPPNRSPVHRRSMSPEKKEPENRTGAFGTEICPELMAALNKRQRKISSGAHNQKGEPPKVPVKVPKVPVKPVTMRNRSRSSGSDSSPCRRPLPLMPSQVRKSSSGSQVIF